MVNFGPLTAEIGLLFGAPRQISMCFASWLHNCGDVADRKSTKLCMMFVRHMRWYTAYTFLEALAP